MLLVLASRFDREARSLVEEWQGDRVRVLTCDGLSRRGWVYEPSAIERSVAVIDDEAVPVPSISGVYTRLAAVSEADLPHVVATERSYVASEMTAFLLAWLSALPCRVINRPTPLSLVGPAWRPEQWTHAARRAGLATPNLRRIAPALRDGASVGAPAAHPMAESIVPNVSVVTVADKYFADEGIDADTIANVRALAAIAGVELLTTTFARTTRGLVFAAAAPSVDVTRPEVRDALQAQLAAPP